MSKSYGKTIQIFLPDGNPRGVKIAEFTSRTVQVILVPRAQLDFAITRLELSSVGLYFLIGDPVSSSQLQLYIGEAEDCSTRLKQQNKSKDWWTTALVCVSKTAGFTKSHVKFLEWHCHKEAGEAGRFALDNTTVPTKSYVSEPMEADLMDHFDTIRILTSTLGYPIFDRIMLPSKQDEYFCKGKQASAKGAYTEDGMVVYKGSVSNKEEAKSLSTYLMDIRSQLLNEGILEAKDELTYRFTKDHIFASPSMAAAVVLARNANGWTEWKDHENRSLDEVKRQGKGK